MINQNPSRFQQEQERRTVLRVPKPIDVVQVQSTATTIFTARDDADFQIESLVATNVSMLAEAITLYLIPSGGSASAGNTIVYQRAIPANSAVTLFDRNTQCLVQPSASIEALCNVNDGVNIWGYGFDYQGIYG